MTNFLGHPSGYCGDQNLGCLGYIGDEILPSYIGIIRRHYKDPYQPINIMECQQGFECGSINGWNTLFVCLLWLFNLYHDKSLLNHHWGEYVFLFPSIEQANPSIWKIITVHRLKICVFLVGIPNFCAAFDIHECSFVDPTPSVNNLSHCAPEEQILTYRRIAWDQRNAPLAVVEKQKNMN